MTIAIAQIESSFGNIEGNVEKIVGYIETAGKEGAKLIIFPELSVTGYPPDFESFDMWKIAEPIPGPTTNLLKKKAEELGIEIIVGLLEVDDGAIFDTAVLVKSGELASYRKTHVHWNEPFDSGDELGDYDSVLGKLGILICFDASFSEPARVLALRGAKTIAIPSAVPEAFEKYAERRMIARALDNQVYVLYCNASGNGFAGNSLIVDPQGEIVAKAGIEEELVFAALNCGYLNEWRKKERIFPTRRPKLYREISKSKGGI